VEYDQLRKTQTLSKRAIRFTSAFNPESTTQDTCDIMTNKCSHGNHSDRM